MRLCLSLLVVCLFTVGHAASVQVQTITGTVVDPAGRPLPGVTVDLRQGATVLESAISDLTGAWRFHGVPMGDYRIRTRLSGFETREIAVTIGTTSPGSLRITLKIGTLAEGVVVTEGAPSAVRRAGQGSAGGAGYRSGIPGGVVGGVVGGLPGAPPPPPPPAQPSSSQAEASSRTYQAHKQFSIATAPAPDTASYAQISENRFRRVEEHPLSTFSVDVDTASYANVRRFLNQGTLPPSDAVRIEELINYFRFDYAEPRGDAPVSVTTEAGPAPWNPAHSLVLVGLKTAPIQQKATPPRNLTFLLDVSGSMQPINRLPLIKTAMRMLVDTLRPEDRVAIVVYAGASGLALPATSGDHKGRIQSAIAELHAGGSTNGAAGIQLAYQVASDNFIRNGINRVILATDGDFNVGITNQSDLTRLIEEKRERGIFLSVLGVGDNNLKDSTMEKLADKGNGNYAYLDSLQEARRVLIAEAGSTLVTVAKDVKLQIEFNPRFVTAYRLIGYENRLLRKEDFNNDRKDAGEMGAGHTVTALYEVVPPGAPVPASDVDPLKYQHQPKPERPAFAANATELMTVKVRYKAPDGDASKLLEFPVRASTARATPNLGFAAAVAEFGMLLRRSEFRGSSTWEQAIALAKRHKGDDPDGYRAEFVRLVDLASALDVKHTTSAPDVRR